MHAAKIGSARARSRRVLPYSAEGTGQLCIIFFLSGIGKLPSLPRSRFLDVTQRSPKRTAAGALCDIQKRLRGRLVSCHEMGFYNNE